MAESLPNASYDSFQMESTYLTLTGQYGMIPAGPDGTPAAIVKAHAKFQRRVISWVATRTGAPPAAPPPEDLDGNNILISASPAILAAVPLVPGGKHVWQLAGVYEYQVVYPVGPDDNLPSGKFPVDQAAASDLAYPASSYDDTLIGRSSGRPKG